MKTKNDKANPFGTDKMIYVDPSGVTALAAVDVKYIPQGVADLFGGFKEQPGSDTMFKDSNTIFMKYHAKRHSKN